MEKLSILQDLSPSTFFFPLRTNVQYFDSPETRLKLEERVKQASLLHDKLLFEGGIYEATAWEGTGSKGFDLWYSPDPGDLEAIAREDETFRPTGNTPALLIDDKVFGSGKAARQFRAQFLVLLVKLRADKLPWISVGTFTIPTDLDNEIKKLARDDHDQVEGLTASSFLRDKIAYNLNRDLLIAAQLGVPASIDDLFGPLVHQKAERDHQIQRALGFSALQVAVPNWSTLPWDEVFKLREHPSLVEFRKKMVTIERMAKEAVAQQAHADLKSEISRIITDEVSDELYNLRETEQGIMGDVIIDLVTSPLSGISTLVTAIKGDMKLQSQNKSWTTAFFKLRKPSS
jgi:hypothetical protein